MSAITEEIWNRRRLELVDELISEDLVDHVDIPGLEGTGRARYLASVELNHSGFSDRREEIELIVADEDKAVSYARVTGADQPPSGAAVGRYRPRGWQRAA